LDDARDCLLSTFAGSEKGSKTFLGVSVEDEDRKDDAEEAEEEEEEEEEDEAEEAR